MLRYLFAVRGCPAYIRSDNGPEFVSNLFRGELLNRELFLHIDELRYVADRWRMDYNHYRPHSSLDYMAPAAFADFRKVWKALEIEDLAKKLGMKSLPKDADMDLTGVLDVKPWAARPRFIEGVDRPQPLVYLINGGKDTYKSLKE